MKKLTLTITLLSFLGFASIAQTTDGWDTYDDAGDTYDDGYNYDDNGGGTFDDSASAGGDSWDDSGWDDSGWDGGGYNQQEYVRSARPTFERKPYERFTGMPYDSATELVTYVEVIEVYLPDDFYGDDYTLSDSLHARAIKWMNSEFGAKETKRMIDESGADQQNREGLTIIAKPKIPLTVQLNEFKKVQSGNIQFTMELRFKDGRYRYKFNNFVHLEQDLGGDKEPITTYMEYYIDAKKNVVHNDQVLIATNNKMNEMIENLKRSCDAAPFIDNDDW